jgi:hypothetical protein
VATYSRCPNCGHSPSGGIGGGVYFDVYRCNGCSSIYCYNCGGVSNCKCPRCGSKKYTKVGECWKTK